MIGTALSLMINVSKEKMQKGHGNEEVMVEM